MHKIVENLGINMDDIKREQVIILDFDGTKNHMVARRVRECDVYCEVYPYNTPVAEILAKKPKGIILCDSEKAVYSARTPLIDEALLDSGVPILGIGYGAHVITHLLGGSMQSDDGESYATETLELTGESMLFTGVKAGSTCYINKGSFIHAMPKGFTLTATINGSIIAAMENVKRRIYGVQFLPEIKSTECGGTIIRNFLCNICGCGGNWTAQAFIHKTIESIRETVGDKKALCALSGGVDSSVCALLMHKAIGRNLTCIFVDHGLMRKNEGDVLMSRYAERFNINVIRVDAEQRFLGKLKGVVNPEEKRRIIGEEFIRVFEEEAAKLGEVDYLVQGTIYPDIMESGQEGAKLVKTHHNAGGLPDTVNFTGIIEPIRDLFKEEVRRVGRELNLPAEMTERQPFPGPGLGVRVVGELTKEKLDLLREVDAIFTEMIEASEWKGKINQYFAILTGALSTGVTDSARTYDNVVALRAINTEDFVTAKYVRLPYELLDRVVARIDAEVDGVSRIVYDVTDKPPATIEWE